MLPIRTKNLSLHGCLAAPRVFEYFSRYPDYNRGRQHKTYTNGEVSIIIVALLSNEYRTGHRHNGIVKRYEEPTVMPVVSSVKVFPALPFPSDALVNARLKFRVNEFASSTSPDIFTIRNFSQTFLPVSRNSNYVKKGVLTEISDV
jgi:hypothetical protein